MPEQTRQLAAIMFTDIVGYTALMGKSSSKALELVRISKEIQKPLVQKHKGKWSKEMGEIELAFKWLEKSNQDHEVEMYWLKVEPPFESLRSDIRYQEMLDKVGFPN